MLVGAHVSTRGGIATGVQRALDIGADVFQTHPTPGQQWRDMRYDDEVLSTFHSAYATSGLRGHWLHAVYLINLASPQDWLLEKSVASLSHYMQLAEDFAADGVVFHPGSHVGAGFDPQLPQMQEALRRVLGSSTANVRLLIENSAGAGGCVGCRFEEVGRMLEASDDPRLGVCLDTQHMFASGYDMRTPETASATLADFDRNIGLERLALVHANDSARPLGSAVDRHANIGEGEIGTDGFRYLLSDARVRQVPWLLETPGVDRAGPDRQQINLLLDCAGVADDARAAVPA